MRKNLLKPTVFLTGLAALVWIGAGYVGTNLLALAVVLLIAACYVAGTWELHRYRQATASLAHAVDALNAPVSGLEDWLARLHPSLRDAVRQRIESGRTPLPAPALTPYLVGLLVLLGMLGTLLGMMTTLQGTGLALENASDLQTLRASIAAPVKGLAFAFGTSIAGVAASAMLGLLSALCRRDRVDVAQALDAAIATTLRPFSPLHQREEAFKLAQRQADALPTLVDRLQAMVAAIEQQNHAANERQLAQQAAFHDRTEAVYSQLAASVQRSLMDGAAESARAASKALQPVVEATMAEMARNAASLHAEVMQSVQQQVEGLSTGFQASTRTVADLWSQSLADQQRSSEAQLQDLRTTLERFAETFDQRSSAMVETVSARFVAATSSASAAWASTLSQQTEAGNALAVRNQEALAAAAATFETHATSLVRVVHESHADLQEHVASRQQTLCDTLARTADTLAAQTQAHARDTIAEISRMVEAASEAPRAAAEVIGELRQNLSDSMARDTAMLEERGRLLATVETLLDAVNHASTEQRTSVDALISTTADLLDRVGNRFTAHVEAETGKLDAAASRIAAGAIEVASLGDTFGAAVQRFGESNEQLVARLHAIEAALAQSLTRSDEQLAYYVAQAREVVDLSVLSQTQIIGELKQLADQRAAFGTEAA